MLPIVDAAMLCACTATTTRSGLDSDRFQGAYEGQPTALYTLTNRAGHLCRQPPTPQQTRLRPQLRTLARSRHISRQPTSPRCYTNRQQHHLFRYTSPQGLTHAATLQVSPY